MIKPPSLQKQYDEFYSFDDAFDHPADGAPKEALEEYARKVGICRDTGDWSSVTLPGQSPTRFVLRHVPPDVFRRIEDLAAGANPRIGEKEHRALLFRCALIDVVDLTGLDGKPVTVKFTNDPQFGRIANTDVPNLLDLVDPEIVNEQGFLVWLRCRGLLGKR